MGCISTVAGDGVAGFSGDSGAATSAEFNYPTEVTVDVSGNLYIADGSNNRIRKVNASTGKISTIAGNGTAGDSGNGGVATSAELHTPVRVAVDAAGNVFVTDQGNNCIREIAAVTSFQFDPHKYKQGSNTDTYIGPDGQWYEGGKREDSPGEMDPLGFGNEDVYGPKS
jgi:sugar lactone lactonase YvrE